MTLGTGDANMIASTLTPVLLAVSILPFGPEPETLRADDPTMNIVEIASAHGSFNTLVAAVKAAGLVETLSGKGPFTVFAPTDEAFAAIPKADLESLLADKEALTAVLTYHVVPGRATADDVRGLRSATTLQGQSVEVEVGSQGIRIDGAAVITADIEATNGVIHVIDRVILPEM